MHCNRTSSPLLLTHFLESGQGQESQQRSQGFLGPSHSLQPRNIVLPPCPVSTVGPPPRGSILEHFSIEAYRRNPKKLAEPPRLTPLDTGEQRFYFKLLLGDWAPNLFQKSSHSLAVTHFGRLYVQSLFFFSLLPKAHDHKLGQERRLIGKIESSSFQLSSFFTMRDRYSEHITTDETPNRLSILHSARHPFLSWEQWPQISKSWFSSHCFTLGCKAAQCTLEVLVWWSQQDRILHKKQRSNHVVPKPEIPSVSGSAERFCPWMNEWSRNYVAWGVCPW